MTKKLKSYITIILSPLIIKIALHGFSLNGPMLPYQVRTASLHLCNCHPSQTSPCLQKGLCSIPSDLAYVLDVTIVLVFLTVLVYHINRIMQHTHNFVSGLFCSTQYFEIHLCFKLYRMIVPF